MVPPTVALGQVLLLVASAAAAQPADSPRLPPNVLLPDATVIPPGIQRLEIRPDTPAERDASLARRRAEMERQKIEKVVPLPAQRLAPAPPPGSEQR